MKYTEFKKLAAQNKRAAYVPYLGWGPELLIAAITTGAGAVGGAAFGAILPAKDKKKSLARRTLEGAGRGAAVGAGVALGRSLGRNAITYAINNHWI